MTMNFAEIMTALNTAVKNDQSAMDCIFDIYDVDVDIAKSVDDASYEYLCLEACRDITALLYRRMYNHGRITGLINFNEAVSAVRNQMDVRALEVEMMNLLNTHYDLFNTPSIAAIEDVVEDILDDTVTTLNHFFKSVLNNK